MKKVDEKKNADKCYMWIMIGGYGYSRNNNNNNNNDDDNNCNKNIKKNEIVIRNEIQNKFEIAVNDKTGNKNKNKNDYDNDNDNGSENGNKNENENEDVCYMESIYKKSNQEEFS